MESTNIKWNRREFQATTGAKVKTMGTHPNTIVVYDYTDKYNNIASIVVGPYTKSVRIEINGIEQNGITFIDLYEVEMIRYVQYDDGNGTEVRAIVVGPAICKRNGTDQFYAVVAIFPNVGVSVEGKEDYEECRRDYPDTVLL